jgi:hypothetical protein
MRLFVAAGFLALAGASGACAALDGLADYRECAGACVDTNTNGEPGDGSSVQTPLDSGEMLDDGTAPPAEAAPTDDETGGGSDANLNDVSSPPHDSGGADAPPPPAEAGIDAGFDAKPPMESGPPPMTGATCGPRGTGTRCSTGQTCCANLAANTNACATSCPANASLSCATASDCPSSAAICCAQATFTIDSAGDLPPKCAVAAFSASCASSCNDVAPTSCTYIGTIRLCSHDADCQSDSANGLAGGQCWNFNSAPESWCTSAAVGTTGGGMHLP